MRDKGDLFSAGYRYWDDIERHKKEVVSTLTEWNRLPNVISTSAIGSLRVAFARGFVQGFKAHEKETSIQEQYEHAERMVVEWAARAEVLKKKPANEMGYWSVRIPSFGRLEVLGPDIAQWQIQSMGIYLWLA